MRQRVLRPHQSVDDLVFPGDDEPDTVHFGAFEGAALVGIASLYREAPANRPDARAWRLRGMATLPEMRGRGYGAALVRACVAHVAERGGTTLWCNARASAAGFYDAFGFVREGPPFELPHIGPHYVMSCRVGVGGPPPPEAPVS